jgi:hypothetical protein
MGAELSRSLHGDQRNPKRTCHLALQRVPIHNELTDDHPKGAQIIGGVPEHGQLTGEVRHRLVATLEAQLIGNVCDTS